MGEFTIQNIDFEITPSTKKHKIILKLDLLTNPFLLKIQIPKEKEKENLRISIDNIIKEKKQIEGTFENFARYIRDELNKIQNLNIIEKFDISSTQPIINIPKVKLTPLIMNEIPIKLILMINFELET